MMTSRTFRAFLATVLLALPSWAQSPYSARQATLASNFDLDGEAADADQVVTAANGVITDLQSYTITADPDICRLVDVTVTDADSSIVAGTLTIDGFDCWGYPLRAAFDLTGGSGVKTGAVEDFGTASPLKASGAYFSDVTAVSNGTVTGEGGAGDTITVGYTTNSPKGWPLYGRQTSTPSGKRWVDVFGSYAVPVLVKSGATTVDVTAVSASTTAPFQNVTVGDILIFNVSGEVFTRRVVSRASADDIAVNAAITLPTAGTTFSYRKRFFSTDPQDGWIPVSGFDAVTFTVEVDLNANTGGVVSTIECATFTTDGFGVPDVIYEVDTDTVASAATGKSLTAIDLRLVPNYTHCRAGINFGTGDDADAAAENIDIVVGFRK